ncbi:hypothetical protein V5P93_003106 [Actinokineospora auranticolor]|uniref:SMI1/KNR4 family protein SUKH-1 n=1 Tax=Actinokineospora auranticolor TaxID=155976 RepID=A0A2S6H1D6_9PSEU|nr:hypothetical protein [Actinokineospora auranticolor]PPK71241.1 hypothetical protein CLV40_101430 [Actinokineospora auranticolor]
MADQAQGAVLVERVIEAVRVNPTRSMLSYAREPWVEGTPTPMSAEALAAARFPSGRPLSPSLKAWLAYDTSLLARHGWFAADGTFAPRPIDRLVGAEFGDPWAPEFAPLNDALPEVFLLPGGSDSRRVLAVGEPDDLGEYPILALDFDDLPYLGLMYPGFDVYLAHTAGLLDINFETYTDLTEDDAYHSRFKQHAAHYLNGERETQFPFPWS